MGSFVFAVLWFHFSCYYGFNNIHSNKHLFVENQHMQLSDTSRQEKKRMCQKKGRKYSLNFRVNLRNQEPRVVGS